MHRSWSPNTSVRNNQVEMSRRQHSAIYASSFDMPKPQGGKKELQNPHRSLRIPRTPQRLSRQSEQSRSKCFLEMRQRLARASRRAVNTQQAVNDGTSASTAQHGDNVFKVLWERIIRPLRDFGFGRKNIWEGGVGLFLMGGFVFMGVLICWVKGFVLRNRAQAYQAVIEFPQACGITVGTPVRVRGVRVGNVLSVKPSIAKVDVLVEVDDSAIAIPKNSTIEANQTGLVAETMIDITPRDPIPTPELSPLDKGCAEEGLVVCHRDVIKGETGYSLDQLVAVMTKLAREVDRHGMSNTLQVGDRMGDMITAARPLIDQALKLSEEVLPVLAEVRDKNLVATLERLTETANSTAADLKRLESAILTDENTELLRKSVATLTKTLQHVESISGDIGSVTGDPMTKHNLRNLIQALSRLVDA